MLLKHGDQDPRRSRRGAAAAEMALVLPVLALLMVGIVDFGRLFYEFVTINTCARNGALYACDPGTQPQSPYASLTLAAQADASNMSPLPTVDSPKYSATAAGPYNSTTPISKGYVDVTVHREFTTLVDYPGIPHTTTLSRSVRMRMLPTSP